MTIIDRIFYNQLTQSGVPKMGLAPPAYFLGAIWICTHETYYLEICENVSMNLNLVSNSKISDLQNYFHLRTTKQRQ